MAERERATDGIRHLGPAFSQPPIDQIEAMLICRTLLFKLLSLSLSVATAIARPGRGEGYT